MKNILIVKCGETIPEIKEKYGDFEDWIIQQSNLPSKVFKVFNISEGQKLRHPSEYIAAILTGSNANVNQRLPWIIQLKDWIITARYSNINLLGICFGHQAIAEALGGKVSANSEGLKLGIANIKLEKTGKEDALFKNTGTSFESYSLHSYHVERIPLGAELLARSEDGINQAFRLDKIYGVQFHPEFTPEVLQLYIDSNKSKKLKGQRIKLKSAFKNQSIISNYFDQVLKLQ